MKVKYVSEYLSIKEFEDIDIDDFAVITGINGAGKSHFLNAIDNGSIKIEGIDSENIILYDYNDFNVVNVDFNRGNNTSELKNKHQVFQNKSNNASQKLNHLRNTILGSYFSNKNYGVFNIDEHFLRNIEDCNFLNWSKEDKEYYRVFDIRNPDTSTSYHNFYNIQSFHSYMSRYQYDKIDDIDTFTEVVNNILTKRQVFDVIRSFDYNKDLKTLDEIRFQEIFNIVKGNPQRDYWNEEYRNKYPSIIYELALRLNHSKDKLLISDPIQFVKKLKEVFKEIEDFFISQIDADTLKQIQTINGYNVLDNVLFDSGFLNLNDIAQEEKNFKVQKEQNEYNKFSNTKGKSLQVYSEDDFFANYGESPIKILNDVLSEYDVNGYEFRTSELDFDLQYGLQNQNMHVYLFNKNGNYQTQLEALSSGEKTLLALAFSVFKLKKKKGIAKVLLMDELDSALHPSMSKRLINVLYNYFYKTLGIKIIISSHSPSTIAFSPDNSLYVIKKGDRNKLHKVSKDEALKELTIGVPSFSINYENRRQVFVESKYDVEYYGALYSIFQNHLNKEVSLNFIASGDVQKDKYGQPNSSCDVVKNVTRILRAAGNKTVFGLIDWDLAKTKDCNSYIITLGFESRYSIENYIFDPLLVGVFLLKEKIEKPDYFGFDETFNLESLFKLTNEDCQIIICKICERITEVITKESIMKFINTSFPETINNENYSKMYLYKSVNTFELEIPYFITVLQGHKLEEYLLKVFPRLNAYAKKDADNFLKNSFISRVIEDFSNYAPKDLLDVLIEAQK